MRRAFFRDLTGLYEVSEYAWSDKLRNLLVDMSEATIQERCSSILPSSLPSGNQYQASFEVLIQQGGQDHPADE